MKNVAKWSSGLKILSSDERKLTGFIDFDSLEFLGSSDGNLRVKEEINIRGELVNIRKEFM